MRVFCIVVCVFAVVLSSRMVYGEESKEGGATSFSEKVGQGAKKIGDAVAEGFKKTAKKLEEKHVPEKVEQKLKKAVDKTAEGFTKAERKIKDKLAD